MIKKIVLLSGLIAIFLLLLTTETAAFESSPIGWASIGDGNVPYTITGGSAGDTVIATDEATFKAYATSTTPYVIIVPTTITMTRGTSKDDTPQTVLLESNKTIIGVGYNPGINGGFSIINKSNIIIRNLNIWYEDATQGSSNPWTDGISTEGTEHLWVDHCNFFDSPDGLLDPTKHSNYITISWCRFYYTPESLNTSHHNANLVGSSDNPNPTDVGKLKETFHHNWWGAGIESRMPRVRFGHVHIFNNYYDCAGNEGYCVGVGSCCQILFESNYCNSVKKPWMDYNKTGQGYIHWNDDNVFFNTIIPTELPNSTVFTPPYSYTLEAGSIVNTRVINGGGVNRLTPSPNPMAFSTAPQALGSSSITMTASAATCEDGVEYKFTCTAGGGHDSGWQAGTTYTDTGLLPNRTYTYTVQARNQTQPLFTSDTSSSMSATTLAGTGLYGDFTGNGIVEMNDMDEFTSYWLLDDCNETADVDLDDDCMVNFYEFAAFAENWMQ